MMYSGYNIPINKNNLDYFTFFQVSPQKINKNKRTLIELGNVILINRSIYVNIIRIKK